MKFTFKHAFVSLFLSAFLSLSSVSGALSSDDGEVIFGIPIAVAPTDATLPLTDAELSEIAARLSLGGMNPPGNHNAFKRNYTRFRQFWIPEWEHAPIRHPLFVLRQITDLWSKGSCPVFPSLSSKYKSRILCQNILWIIQDNGRHRSIGGETRRKEAFSINCRYGKDLGEGKLSIRLSAEEDLQGVAVMQVDDGPSYQFEVPYHDFKVPEADARQETEKSIQQLVKDIRRGRNLSVAFEGADKITFDLTGAHAALGTCSMQ